MNYATSTERSKVHIMTPIGHFCLSWIPGSTGIEWRIDALGNDGITWSSPATALVRLLNIRGKRLVEFGKATVTWQEPDGSFFAGTWVADSRSWSIKSRDPSEARWHVCTEYLVLNALSDARPFDATARLVA
jgi:hypothetical protein